MKAIFKLTLEYPISYKLLSASAPSSNGAILPIPPTHKLTVFPQTEKIPPQTMSWTMLRSRISNTKDVVSVWATDIRLTDTALNAAVEAVKQHKDYLNSSPDTPRRVEKLDIVTSTNTKYPGVNNWGLQIYSENAIEFYETESSTYQKQRVWQIVTRESAHQWFGDVVTPKWWDEIWLSVGFATYFEYFALAEMNDQFVVQQTQVALQLDCYGDVSGTHSGKHRESHALIIPKVETTSEIDKVFNNITYNKGASVVRMLNAIMGEENFKRGIRSYLLNKKYDTVDSEYLWTTMASSLPSGSLPTGLTLSQAMGKWTKQTGFPEIVVTRDYNAKSVKFSQSQFLIPPHKVVGTPTWNVPIFWTAENDPTKTTLHWLQPDDDKNLTMFGFYRVNYDQKNWQLLSKSYLNLTTSSRAMLLDDALNLARGDRLDYVTALEVTELLPNETNLAPWCAALTGLDKALKQKYILEKLNYVYDSIGGFRVIEFDSHVRRLMKQLVLHWACRVGHKTCHREAEEVYNSWSITSTSTINPDLRRVTYCTAVQNGGSVVFNRFLASYILSTTIKLDKPRIVYALGCATDAKLLNDYLIHSLETTTPPVYPTGRQVFTAVCQNTIGVQLAFNFLMTHWHQASEAWGGLAEVGRAFSEDLAPKLNTPEQLKQLKVLLAYSTLGVASEGVQLAIGTLEDTLVWQENHRDEVIGAMGGYRRPPISAASPISISVILLFFALFIRLGL
ncbi:hypothetical protein B566_EDAN002871 [Ephemera danica]|nr:hypothetical protein B566_EDAN002871 [Ephemera danica]